LEVHFPGCTRISDNILQQVPKMSPLYNCNEVRRIVTEDRIKWAFSTMAPYNTPGQNGIYPASLQKGCESLLHQYVVFIELPCQQGTYLKFGGKPE